MYRDCAICAGEFPVTEEDLQFLRRLSPLVGSAVLELPPPSCCPQCRLQRRAAHRNERNLYSAHCAISNKPIIAIFAPDSGYTVYSQESWWSDAWDPKAFGREFDFSRPFFEQFAELQRSVPRISSLVKSCENCEYTNHSGNNKNCYLSSILFNCEDVFYSRKIFSALAVSDCAYIFDRGELLYECFWGESLYNCRFCDFCSDCSKLSFCFDCRSCHDCFMSSNLRGARFVFRNQPLSEQEYQARLSQVDFGSYHKCAELGMEYAKLAHSAWRPALRIEESEDAHGDFLLHCKDTFNCYYAALGERCRHCVEFDRSANDQGSIDCMDSLGFGASELLYEVQAQANGYNNKFCSWSYDVANSCYLDMCFNVRDCFGCVGLHEHEQFCILNRAYSQAEYVQLVPRIVEHMRKYGEWGEFFSVSLSPFSYNNSFAMELFPLTKLEALQKGFSWSDREHTSARHGQAIEAAQLPDNIVQADQSLVGKPIQCERSGKAFRFLKEEIELYKRLRVPLPRISPDLRHQLRSSKRPGFELREEKCANCQISIETTYGINFSRAVLCQQCYQQILYK